MIKIIARKEITEMWRDGRFRLTGGLLFGLALVSLIAGVVSYRAEMKQRNALQTTERENWLNLGEIHPHSAAHIGRTAFKPTTPLSLVDTGLNSYIGTSVKSVAHIQSGFQDRPSDDFTAFALFGELTAATVLQLLVPLLIVLLTFASFAGERESGTLRQILSVGVNRNSLILGKILGFSTVFFLLLLPIAVLGGAAIVLSGGENPLDSLARLSLMCFGYLLYFGAFFGLSLGVSAIASSSRLALIVLVGFWIVGCIFLPRVAAEVADRIYSVPSTQDFIANVYNARYNGIDGKNSREKRKEELKQQLFAKYNVSRIQDLPIYYPAATMIADEEYSDEVFKIFYADLWNTYERQLRVQQIAAVVSPSLAVRQFSSAMAGTDIVHHRHFFFAANDFRSGFIRFLNDYLMSNVRMGEPLPGYETGSEWQSYKAGKDMIEEAPDFQYTPLTVGDALRPQILNLLLLISWFAAAWIFAFVAVRRMSLEVKA